MPVKFIIRHLYRTGLQNRAECDGTWGACPKKVTVIECAWADNGCSIQLKVEFLLPTAQLNRTETIIYVSSMIRSVN
jgi:hypothetical protein